MGDKCIFEFFYHCKDTDKLQVSQSGGDRVHNIIDASKQLGHDIHTVLQAELESDRNFQVKYHKNCVSRYLTKAKRTSEKRTSIDLSSQPEKRTRSLTSNFDWLQQCIYCSQPCEISPDPKNPSRWKPAYMVRETETSLEVRIREKCIERDDDWSADILERLAGLAVRAADLHAADARYHRECYSRFFSGRLVHGEARGQPSSLHHSTIELLAQHLQSHRSQIWNSVQLLELYLELGGKPIRRSNLITSICEQDRDLIVLSSPGYRSLIFFRDNTVATLKMTKGDEEDDNLEAALDVVAKRIKKECSEITYQRHTYSTKISKELSAEYSSDTLLRLLGKLSLDEDSLPSLLIGNIITSGMTKHPTPLQIALGVYFHKKKTITHMHDYLVSCSYDELKRFKKSSAKSKYTEMCKKREQPTAVNGLVQIIIDNFDANLSSPNGLVSTHDMATIETHSASPTQEGPGTIPRISKSEMSSPICNEEEDEIIPYVGSEKPLPPDMPPSNIPDAYTEAQRISYERANDMDYLFFKTIITSDGKVPEWSGWNTHQCRMQGHIPTQKTHIIYHPLIMAKPSDPSTVYTSMLKAQRITAAAGQEYTIFTADQQLYKVAVHIMWDHPQQFVNFIPRLGGMHFLQNIIGCIGSLAAGSGCVEVLEAAFGGVAKMLSGKKYPQNFRALVLLTEELLHPIISSNAVPAVDISSMDELQSHLDSLSTQSRTARFWIDVIIRPTLLCMKFVRAERDGDFALHTRCVKECLPLFFAAKHHQYLRYGVVYLYTLERLPDSVYEHFMQGHHAIHLRAGLWNGIWSDMGIETTWMKKGHGPEGVVGSTTNPDSIKTWAYSYHDCLSLTTGLDDMRDPDAVNVQLTHKEEGESRMKADEVDRKALRDKLAVCIQPLNPAEHPRGLVNIVTGEVMLNEDINVDQAMEIGKRQLEEFETGWPETFHVPVKNCVITWTANKMSINVSGQKIVDMGIFYARALALQASDREGVPTICDMLAYELAPVATSMFDDDGQMRSTAKSVLKKEMAVERSSRGIEKDAVILDGCAVLWAVQFPAGDVTVEVYIDAFRKHVRHYQETSVVYLIFDRYITGSTKEVTRWKREKGASRVFRLRLTSRLPARSLLFSVVSNKVQVINMIIQDLIAHKDDPVTHTLIVTGPDPVPLELPGPAGDTATGEVIQRHDLLTTQEEADTIIIQQAAHHAAENQAIVVVADDTDVFALLLHYRHIGMIKGSNVYMQSPLRGRAVIDIDATIQNNKSIIPVLLAAHALSGCDVVASYFNIGKGVALKVLKAGGVTFDAFGNSALPMDQYSKLFAEARAFILACYSMRDCTSLNEARFLVWKNKMKRNSIESPKLCSLPPTEAAFSENVLRAHIAVAIWRDCLTRDPPTLNPTEHGWYHPEGSAMLLPTIVPQGTPLAPADLLKLIKCGCCSNNPCSSKRCSCRANGLRCTLFCHCKGEEDCKNK